MSWECSIEKEFFTLASDKVRQRTEGYCSTRIQTRLTSSKQRTFSKTLISHLYEIKYLYKSFKMAQ